MFGSVFAQGWFKFGGVEFFKIKSAEALGTENAWKYRLPIYLGAAAAAEFIADIFLCPLEATRMLAVMSRLLARSSYISRALQVFVWYRTLRMLLVW